MKSVKVELCHPVMNAVDPDRKHNFLYGKFVSGIARVNKIWLIFGQFIK